MESATIEIVFQRLNGLIQQKERGQGRFGERTWWYMEDLPALFRLFHRITFDLDVPPEHRRRAACIAVYISEPHDFHGESGFGVEGLIDDLWLAYTGLRQLADHVPLEVLQRHWRSDSNFLHALDRSRDIREVERHVPSRVLEKLKVFIA